MKFVIDQEAMRVEKEKAATQRKQETDALIEKMHTMHAQKEMYVSLLARFPLSFLGLRILMLLLVHQKSCL